MMRPVLQLKMVNELLVKPSGYADPKCVNSSEQNVSAYMERKHLSAMRAYNVTNNYVCALSIKSTFC